MKKPLQYPFYKVFVLVISLLGIINTSYSQTITTWPVSSPQCSGNNIIVSFFTAGSFNPGNIFTAQLSNASGSFFNPTTIGSTPGISGGTVNATIPVSIPTGSGYRIRIISSSPNIIGSDNGTNITITSSLPPAVTMVSHPAGAICAGTMMFFQAAAYNTGNATVEYTFKVNGIPVQTGPSDFYMNSSLNNGDVVTCSITATGATCAGTNTVTSNAVTVIVSTAIVPTITIATVPPGPPCANILLVFVATTSGTSGGGVNYDFKVNGVTFQSSGSNTCPIPGLVPGDVVSCTLTVFGASCLATTTAYSNLFIMTSNPVVTPTVSLASNPSGPVCAGNPVTFTATGNNLAGGTATYTFLVNGVTAQSSNSNTFTTTTLNNGDIVTCNMSVTGGACLTTNYASSNPIAVTVNSTLTPAVALTSNMSGAVCPGSPVIVTATTSNTGGGPVTYNFMVNGVSVQYGLNNVFSSSILANGDVVSCSITVSGTCLTSNTANSNLITIVISSAITPTVSLTAPAGTTCLGSSITFTATSNITGGTVIYNFKVNGISVQNTNSNSFTTNTLVTGDVVSCSITVSGINCLTTNTATSNNITVAINPVYTPSVSISANQPGPICQGTSLTITATALSISNGTVNYDFKKNGISVQSSASNVFTSNILVNGDVITCTITVTGGTCLLANTANSNQITIAVTPNQTPTVVLSSTLPGPICAGTPVTFTGTAAGLAGGTVVYNFRVNGTSIQSSSSNTFVAAGLNNGDNVSCTITITGGNCLTTNTAASNVIVVQVNPMLTPSVSLAVAPAGSICPGAAVIFTATANSTGGGSVNYDFKVNGISVQSGSANIYNTTTLASSDLVSCTITITGGTCLTVNTASSNSITVVVNPSLTPAVVISTNQPGAICPGTPVTFTAIQSNTSTGTIIFDFKKNGVTVQSSAANTFTTSSLVNGDVISCTISVTGGICLASNSANSNLITTVVNQNLTPSVSISSTLSGPICAGSPVTFTASALSTGTGSINYDFKVNGVSVQSGTSNTFTTSTLNNNDNVSCTITITGGNCLTTNTAASNVIAVQVNPMLTPSVSLAVAPTGSICPGTAVTITATANITGGGSVNYDFKVNGVSVQSGSGNIYNTTTLASSDLVSCTITITGGSCLTVNTASSNSITVVVNPSLTPAVVISTNQPGAICPGTPVTFTAISSNTSTGSIIFDFKKNGVTVQSSVANTFTTSSLVNGDVISCSIIVTGGICLAANSANSNLISTVVNQNLTPSVSISSTLTGPICAGSPVTFTAIALSAGTGSISYDFKVNGVSTQSGTSNTFTTSTLNNNDNISCTITITGGTCLTANNATSNTIAVTVLPMLTPGTTISASPAGSFCPGTAVTFTATATNTAGGTMTYDFKINGLSVQSSSSNIYTTTNLAAGDLVSCTINITGGICLSANTATSNIITTVLDPVLVPAVTLVTNQPGPVCAGTPIIFTASSANTGGGTITYEFKKNGVSVQNGTANTYTSNSILNGDVISCSISIVGGTCLSANSANSNLITTIVNPNITPAVTLTAPLTGPICAGTPVTFTATATNSGGGNLNYDFNINGVSVQSSVSNYFTSNTLNDGDIVNCIITVTGANCLTTNNASSNTITVEVNPMLTPAVSISANPAGPVCSGTLVTFAATTVNAGAGTIYNFKLNGVSVQSGTSNSYSSSTLSNADIIICSITTTDSCRTSNTANSNTLTMAVITTLTPALSLTAFPSGPVCPGTLVTFTAVNSNTNGGIVSFNFKVNGVSVQNSISPTYSTTSLNHGDSIFCTISITGGTCLSANTATSNTIVAALNPTVTPSVAIVADQPGPVCLGTMISFTASVTNTNGAVVNYAFKKNGIVVQNGPANIYRTSSIASTDVLSCDISLTGGTCLATNIASSNVVSIIVDANVTPSVNIISVPAGPVCSGMPVSFTASPANVGGGTVNYDFKVNGISAQTGTSNTFVSAAFDDGDDISCTITVSGARCLTTPVASSNIIELDVNPVFNPSVTLALPADPVCPGTAITFTATASNTGSANILYDFRVNGISVQNSGSNVFSSVNLTSRDRVTCMITLSGGNCLVKNSANSATVAPNISNTACPDQFFAPTGFTPNNDGKNDTFKPVIYGKAENYTLTIFNRWGQRVFETKDLAKGWDGKVNGSNTDSNVFVWVCTFNFIGGQKEVRKGTVMLIR